MTVSRTEDYPGRIKNLKEVHTLPELIEFILPYGLAKVYMTANRRWSFLEKDRRRKAVAIMLNRAIRKFAFNIWDIRTAEGGFMEDFHTMPVIGIIDAIITEFAIQKMLIQKGGNFFMATFKLCGEGYISKELKIKIDELHSLKMMRENNINSKNRKSAKPLLYDEAVSVLYALEEELIKHHKSLN